MDSELFGDIIFNFIYALVCAVFTCQVYVTSNFIWALIFLFINCPMIYIICKPSTWRASNGL